VLEGLVIELGIQHQQVEPGVFFLSDVELGDSDLPGGRVVSDILKGQGDQLLFDTGIPDGEGADRAFANGWGIRRLLWLGLVLVLSHGSGNDQQGKSHQQKRSGEPGSVMHIR